MAVVADTMVGHPRSHRLGLPRRFPGLPAVAAATRVVDGKEQRGFSVFNSSITFSFFVPGSSSAWMQ